MIVAVADVDVSRTIDVDPMRASQSALPGISIGTIPFCSVSDQRFNLASRLANDANRMALGIGEVDIAFEAQRDPLGARQLGQLGRSAVIGARSFQRQTLVELRVGPLSQHRFTEFLADPELIARLRHAIRHVMGREMEFNLRLVLAKEDIPDTRLGQSRLGRTSWLSPQRKADADDLRLYRVAQVEAA